MENNKLVPVEYSGQRILTTEHIARIYGTTPETLLRNFQRNTGRYTEGKHYYRLEGEILKDFLGKSYLQNISNEHLASDNLSPGSDENSLLTIGKRATILYLWTEKGAWLLAKSLNTDKAWQACETLVDDYYRRGEDILALRQQVVSLAQENTALHESSIVYLDIIEKSVTMPGLSEEGLKHIESFGVTEALMHLRKVLVRLETKEHITQKDLQALREAIVDVCRRSVDVDTELVMVSKRFLQQEQVIAQLQSDREKIFLANGTLPLLLPEQGE